MTTDEILQIAVRALLLVVTLSAPVVLAGLVVGLAVSVFQAATQIQEQTLAVIPKLVAVYLTLAVVSTWMFAQLLAFARDVFTAIGGVGQS